MLWSIIPSTAAVEEDKTQERLCARLYRKDE